MSDNKKPTVLGVRAFVEYNDGLVVVEQTNFKGEDTVLIFPGGGLEAGESIFDAAVREVKEETHIEVEAKNLMYIREVKVGEQYGIEFYVHCVVTGGELSLGHDPEHDEKKQILKRVATVSFNTLAKEKNWFPKELHSLLVDDLKNKKTSIQYLGLTDLS